MKHTNKNFTNMLHEIFTEISETKSGEGKKKV